MTVLFNPPLSGLEIGDPPEKQCNILYVFVYSYIDGFRRLRKEHDVPDETCMPYQAKNMDSEQQLSKFSV